MTCACGVACHSAIKKETKTLHVMNRDDVMRSKRSRCERTTSDTVPCIRNTRGGQTRAGRKRVSGCLRRGAWESGERLLRGTGFLFEMKKKYSRTVLTGAQSREHSTATEIHTLSG